MKKIIILFSLILIIISPFNVSAVTKEGKIDTTSALANTQTKVGDYFTISFSVWFWGLQKNTYDTYGVGAVAFTIEMDNDDFLISSVSSDVWDTDVYDLGNGKYYFVSQYIDGSDDNNACIEKELYCSSYNIDVEFFVKNTNKKNSSIVMTSAIAGLIDLSKEYEEITEDDIIKSTYTNIRTVTMTIQQPSDKDTYQEPNNNIIEKSNDVPSVTSTTQNKEINNSSENKAKSNINNNSSVTVSKSNNNYLKSLEIEGFNIEFSKEEINYNINVNEVINSLKINAIPEDDKSNVEIIGADDLKQNDGNIFINVKAENGDIKKYTISVHRGKDEIEGVVKKEKQKNNAFKLEKKHIILGSIIVGSIIITVFIIFLINRIRDRKVEKELDSL